ncbi:MAG: hypothetical protein CVU43_06950 [Chloroflexi bacterium HGW-Chloroflexi-5]|nr:MAG: hypothetical protein CVU43_06950 [Chloroflexi bacterium HGW-Chloroflexi-5]
MILKTASEKVRFFFINSRRLILISFEYCSGCFAGLMLDEKADALAIPNPTRACSADKNHKATDIYWGFIPKLYKVK